MTMEIDFVGLTSDSLTDSFGKFFFSNFTRCTRFLQFITSKKKKKVSGMGKNKVILLQCELSNLEQEFMVFYRRLRPL